MSDRMLSDEILLGLIKKNGGGGGGTTNYNNLENLPQIGGVTLKGNKTLSDLGIASASALANKVDKVEGKGLSTNDFTNTDKTAISDNTTAISGIKNGEGINSFGGVESALALKQNATDNTLETDAKTIVGAINEHEGDISSLKSGLTNLDTEVNGDATTYPYADVITIEDAVPSNLADCSVKVEPVQDLHGYANPWVGGAGKNKLPMTVDGIKAVNTSGTWSGNAYTLNGCTFTVQTDNDGNVIGILVNGTAVRDTEFYVFSDTSNSCPFNGMLINGCINGSNATYDLRVSDITTSSTQQTTGDGEIINVAATGQWRCTIMIRSGYATSNLTFYPMIRLATETDATFAPYTNICPISGSTEVSVQRDGKNLLNPTKFARKDPNSGDASNNWAIWEDYIRCDYNDSLTLNCGIGHVQIYRIIVSCFDKYMNFIGNISETYIYGDGYTFTINIAGTKYCRVQLYNANSMAGYDFSTAQLELGQTATPYEPYSGKTYTIALGDTIYGGTVDFDSGVMTVTHQYVTKNTSTMNNLEQYPGWTGAGIKQIVGAGIDGVISTCVNVSDVIRANTLTVNDILFFEKNDIGLTQTELIALAIDVEFIVELATPTTIQLTPQQIQLLKGTNTLTASTGQISVTANGVSGAIGSVQEQVNELAEDKTGFVKIAQPIKTLTDSTESYTVPCDCYMNAFLKSSTGYTAYIKVGNTEIISVSNSTDPDGRYITLPIKKGSVITMREGLDYTYRILFYEIA